MAVGNWAVGQRFVFWPRLFSGDGADANPTSFAGTLLDLLRISTLSISALYDAQGELVDCMA